MKKDKQIQIKPQKSNKKFNFEYLGKIHNKLKHKDRKGNVWVSNEKKFNEIWSDEYKNRLRILDLSIAIEMRLDYLISVCLGKDGFGKNFMEEILLHKIDFGNKIESFRSIFEESYEIEEDLGIVRNGNNIAINEFIIKIPKFFENLHFIREVRNHSVHQQRVIYSARDTFIKHSNRKMFDYKEFDKDEILIKGHFILWILESIFSENFVNQVELKKYFQEYFNILKGISDLRGENNEK